ncbi:MAG: UDP-2,3-diacylglucosamine diphosphatase [Cyclobacteriaceae bacterium]
MAKKPASIPDFHLSKTQKIYFASDFHLGAPDEESSSLRERKIVRWLDHVAENASAIFLVGDIFDFWFEYKHTIPKGFVRFQGKLAELRDRNIPIYFFTGNHDLWMFDYFPKELGIPVFHQSLSLNINQRRVLVGHGDGLAKGGHTYKFLKKLFTNRFCQWLFSWLHPNIGIGIANYWSNKSRLGCDDDESKGMDEPLLQYCKRVENSTHHDLYIFGHRHLPLSLKVTDDSTYFSLGEWINHFSYLEIDEKKASLKTFDN